MQIPEPVLQLPEELNGWLAVARTVRYKVALLAAHMGRSEKQLWRYFKQREHRKPKAFLDYVRAVGAAQALERGRAAKATAVEFHYHDSAHLHRALRKHLNTSPLEIIKRRNVGVGIDPVVIRTMPIVNRPISTTECPNNTTNGDCAALAGPSIN